MNQRYNVWLAADGLEAYANGATEIWNWYFSVRKEGELGPQHSVKVGEFVADLPHRTQCAAFAVAALEEKKRDAYVEAESTVREISERIQNLLALPAPEGT